MKAAPELLIGRIAVERGLVSAPQLDECIREQAANGGLPIGSILVRKGYLQPLQLAQLLEEQQRRLTDLLDLSDPRVEDAILGRLLIRQGLATETQVNECLRLQAESGTRLGELLVQKNYIASDAMETALLLKKKEVLACPKCGASYSTLGADPAKKYTCKKCGCVLEREERMFHPGESTGVVRVDLPDDAAEHAKNPERRFAGGKYILVQEVGRGGMGVVWKAWQTDLRRYVAVKLLAGMGWTDHDLRRFHREAQLAAGLSHSNIAAIYEVGADAGRHYIAMEFVDGEPLTSVIVPSQSGRTATTRRHVGLRPAVEWIRESALAIDYAHSKGLIHRDVKPGNLMVTRQGGRVYVMDFGLARPVKGEDSITVSDAIVGTPSYMSPEQARGDTLDRRADVYSLGAVLYYVLTGRPPFSGHAAPDILMKVVADDPIPPRRINPRVHADLETICLKALDKDRHRRYDSARTFADDLGRYLEGEPISARPLSPRERLWRLARRRPVAAVAAAGSLAALLVFVLTLLIISWRRGSEVEGYVREGDEFFAKEDFEKARTAYEKALVLDAGHEIAAQRKRLCESAIEGRKKNVALQVAPIKELADALYDSGSYDAALFHYKRILQIDPRNQWAGDRRRLCLEGVERHKKEEQAREKEKLELQMALAAEKQKAEKRLRAVTLYEAARTALEAAARIQMLREFAIADVLQKLREALEALNRALREDEGHVESLFLRGIVRFRMADFQGADEDWAKVLGLARDHAAAAFQISFVAAVRYQLHSRAPFVKVPEEVKKALGRQLEQATNVTRMTAPVFERWGAKALLHLHGRQFDEALEDIGTVRAEGSGRYVPALLRAIIHLEAGNDAQALPGFIQALELEPVAYEALYLRALLRDRQDDVDGALEDAQKVVLIGPDNHLSYLLRAHLQQRKSDPRRALADLEKAAKLPNAPAEEIRAVIENLKAENP